MENMMGLQRGKTSQKSSLALAEGFPRLAPGARTWATYRLYFFDFRPSVY
jgi:hypothetical protein